MGTASLGEVFRWRRSELRGQANSLSSAALRFHREQVVIVEQENQLDTCCQAIDESAALVRLLLDMIFDTQYYQISLISRLSMPKVQCTVDYYRLTFGIITKIVAGPPEMLLFRSNVRD